MALKTLQNFYKATVATAWGTGTGNRYVSSLPTPSSGYLVINPSNTSKREIVTYSATGTDGGGTYVTLSARGVGGTSDQTHAIGETVRMNLTALHYTDIQTELDLKLDDSQLDTDGTLAANSATKIPAQSAVKTYALPLTYLDTDGTLAANSDTKVASQKATKTYIDGVAVAGSPNASTTAKGIVEEATSSEIIAGTAAGATGARLFINPTAVATSGASKVVLSGTDGSLDSSLLGNVLPLTYSVVTAGPFNSASMGGYGDTTAGFIVSCGAAGVDIWFQYGTTAAQQRTITSDWADANRVNTIVVLGSYLYALLVDNSTAIRVYRYDKTNIAAGGTLMTTSGQSLAWVSDEIRMTSNGTDIFFNFKAGNSANDYVISRYTLSGTVLTYVSDITCGSTSGRADLFVKVDTSNNVWLYDSADNFIRKFDSSGTLQSTSISVWSTFDFWNYGTAIYLCFNTTNQDGGSRYWFSRIYIN